MESQEPLSNKNLNDPCCVWRRLLLQTLSGDKSSGEGIRRCIYKTDLFTSAYWVHSVVQQIFTGCQLCARSSARGSGLSGGLDVVCILRGLPLGEIDLYPIMRATRRL